MPFLVLGLGLLLAASGFLFMAFGWPIIQVERGWAMVIAGAAMLSGGLVTAALALVLRAVERLNASARLAPAVIDTPSVETVEPKLAERETLPPIPAPDPVKEPEAPELAAATPVKEPEDTPAPVPAERPHPIRRMPGPKVFDVPPPPAPSLDPVTPALGASKAPKIDPPVADLPAAEPLEVSPAIDDWLDHDLRDPAPEPEHDTSLAAPTQPDIGAKIDPKPEPEAGPTVAVVGRYEADGTSYVMYADGSIEAQSPAGVYRFSSMAELKAFIEG